MAELLIALVIDAGGIIEELGIARDIVRVEPAISARSRLVVRIIEVRAVGPVEPVERTDRHQRDIVRHVAARSGPTILAGNRDR
jgi:hypothetical protein